MVNCPMALTRKSVLDGLGVSRTIWLIFYVAPLMYSSLMMAREQAISQHHDMLFVILSLQKWVSRAWAVQSSKYNFLGQRQISGSRCWGHWKRKKRQLPCVWTHATVCVSWSIFTFSEFLMWPEVTGLTSRLRWIFPNLHQSGKKRIHLILVGR